MIGDFRQACRSQAVITQRMGSPFTARLLRLLAERLRPDTDVGRRLLDWPGDLSSEGDAVPLRMTGALHALALENTAELAPLYPPNPMPQNDQLWDAITAVLHRYPARLNALLDTAPQTNEVARSAVLIALGQWLADHYNLPLVLSELGASAGLNLNWDRYGLWAGDRYCGPPQPHLTLTPEWKGPPPPQAQPQITDRRGVDLNPLNQTLAEHRLRLRAYVWPDQRDRLDRMRKAQEIAQAPVDQGDAAQWLGPRLATPRPGTCHLIFHTVAWQYFPQDIRAKCQAQIEAAGARATADAPLAWFGMEVDDESPGAGLSLRLWPGIGPQNTSAGEKIDMGRADFHGRWVDWRANPARSK